MPPAPDSDRITAPALSLRTYLDPRPAELAAARPVRSAVNIPSPELATRTNELPPANLTVHIAGIEPWASEALHYCHSRNRPAALRHDWTWADAPEPQPGRLWHPSPFLAEVLAQLPPGAALDLACGTGRDAVYMASLGWRVTAVDALPDALDRARTLASRYHDAICPIEWLQLDLKRDPRPATWSGAFDLVTMVRFLHRPLLQQSAQLLRPGGSLVIEAFTTAHRMRPRQSLRRFVAPGELPSLIPGLHVMRHEEGGSEPDLARLWATRD